MAKTLAGVLAVSMAALLFAACGGGGGGANTSNYEGTASSEMQSDSTMGSPSRQTSVSDQIRNCVIRVEDWIRTIRNTELANLVVPKTARDKESRYFAYRQLSICYREEISQDPDLNQEREMCAFDWIPWDAGCTPLVRTLPLPFPSFEEPSPPTTTAPPPTSKPGIPEPCRSLLLEAASSTRPLTYSETTGRFTVDGTLYDCSIYKD